MQHMRTKFGEHAKKGQWKSPKQESSAPFSPSLRPFTKFRSYYAELFFTQIILNLLSLLILPKIRAEVLKCNAFDSNFQQMAGYRLQVQYITDHEALPRSGDY